MRTNLEMCKCIAELEKWHFGENPWYKGYMFSDKNQTTIHYSAKSIRKLIDQYIKYEGISCRAELEILMMVRGI